MVERLQESILPAAASAIETLVDQAAEARDRAQPATASVVATGAETAEVVVSKTTSAARESLALLAWLSAAAALVYFVILNEERRERLRNFIVGVVDQTQLLVQDFQGYEEDI